MECVSIRAKVITDATGAVAEIPILLTSDGPLLPLVDYLLHHRHVRSLSWMQKVVQAVNLLLAYMVANAQHFSSPQELFQIFVQRLYTGTIGDDGIDPSGLYWKPQGHETARNVLTRLSDFSDWLVTELDRQPLNPHRKPSRYDELAVLAAREHRRSRAFLGHTWGPTSGSVTLGRTVAKRMPKVGFEDDAVAFPEKHFTDLLLNGFIRRGGTGKSDVMQRLHIRDCLITLLMHGAGFRVSECFHLWVDDVRPDPFDPTVAQVRIHHPSLGAAPEDWLDERGRSIKCNRAAYLAGKYALRPRTELIDHHSAGWKEPLLDGEYFMQAYWFPTELGRIFLRLWKVYLRYLAAIERFHPYAFVVEQQGNVGGIYCIPNYKQAHAVAVKRIGLTVEKGLGTTPHGHRHAYGRRLKRFGIDPIFRKKALHHKSINSQTVYTALSAAEVSAALSAASSRLDVIAAEDRYMAAVVDMEKLLASGFEDVDPDGLFSGPNPKLRK